MPISPVHRFYCFSEEWGVNEQAIISHLVRVVFIVGCRARKQRLRAETSAKGFDFYRHLRRTIPR